MEGALKKGVGLLVIVFAIFWIFQDPSGAAGATKESVSAIWDLLVRLFEALIRFIDAIFG
jgi:hypothetical protein